MIVVVSEPYFHAVAGPMEVAKVELARGNLLLVGAAEGQPIKEFSAFATQLGYQLHVAEPERLVAPEISQTLDGIVLFLDSCDTFPALVVKSMRYLDIPMVAVSSRYDNDTFARLTAAGISLLSGTDQCHERIVSEVSRVYHSVPIVSEIRQNLLGPFVDSIVGSLQAMANTSAVVRSSYQKNGYKMFGDVSAVIGLVASAEGSMVLSFPEATAVDVSKRILAGIDDNPDSDMVRDCVGEFANVVAGQAKGILSSTPFHFTLSTPTVISGDGHEIRHKPGMPCLVTAFGTEIGDFALQLCLSTR